MKCLLILLCVCICGTESLFPFAHQRRSNTPLEQCETFMYLSNGLLNGAIESFDFRVYFMTNSHFPDNRMLFTSVILENCLILKEAANTLKDGCENNVHVNNALNQFSGVCTGNGNLTDAASAVLNTVDTHDAVPFTMECFRHIFEEASNCPYTYVSNTTSIVDGQGEWKRNTEAFLTCFLGRLNGCAGAGLDTSTIRRFALLAYSSAYTIGPGVSLDLDGILRSL